MDMNLEIITEEEGNPFIFHEGGMSYGHAFSLVRSPLNIGREWLTRRKARKSSGRDYYRNPEILNEVLKNVLGFVDIPQNKVLEVGAGHHDDKLEFLTSQGYDAYALDADSTALHKHIPSPRKSPITGSLQSELIPFYVGSHKGVEYYHGDIGFLQDPASELDQVKFGLVLFYGSIFANGSHCRSIAQSRVSWEAFDMLSLTTDKTEWKTLQEKYLRSFWERMDSAKEALADGGHILVVSDDFNGYLNQKPEIITESRLPNLDLLLRNFQDAKKIVLFSLTRPYVERNLRAQGYKQTDIDSALNVDVLNGSKNPKELNELTPDNLRNYFGRLGSIDAFVATY